MSDQNSTIPDHSRDPYPYDDDEINLLDLFLVLLKYKKMIIGTVVLAGIAAVVISLLMDNIYRSSATIIPQTTEQSSSLPSLSGLGAVGGFLGLGGNNDLSKLEVVLNSREVSLRIVKKYKLLPLLFADDWDGEKKKWLTDEPPTEQDAVELVKEGLISVLTDEEKNAIYVNVDHKDPQFAKQMVEYYLTELSEVLRENTLRDAEEKVVFLQEELSRTSDVLLQEKITTLLASEIEKEIFARAQKYFTFEVIDPPISPDLDKKIKPKRSIICILAVVVAFIVAVVAVFILEFINNVKENAEPEQLARLRGYTSFTSGKNTEN
jgi:uncharacterized protein involved in exopolysaccharide biosynthesis